MAIRTGRLSCGSDVPVAQASRRQCVDDVVYRLKVSAWRYGVLEFLGGEIVVTASISFLKPSRRIEYVGSNWIVSMDKKTGKIDIQDGI